MHLGSFIATHDLPKQVTNKQISAAPDHERSQFHCSEGFVSIQCQTEMDNDFMGVTRWLNPG